MAEDPPRLGRIDVAGPEVVHAREVARTRRSVTGSRALLVPVPLPGKLGRALRGGALTAERHGVRGTTPFEAWLAAVRGLTPGGAFACDASAAAPVMTRGRYVRQTTLSRPVLSDGTPRNTAVTGEMTSRPTPPAHLRTNIHNGAAASLAA